MLCRIMVAVLLVANILFSLTALPAVAGAPSCGGSVAADVCYAPGALRAVVPVSQGDSSPCATCVLINESAQFLPATTVVTVVQTYPPVIRDGQSPAPDRRPPRV